MSIEISRKTTIGEAKIMIAEGLSIPCSTLHVVRVLGFCEDDGDMVNIEIPRSADETFDEEGFVNIEHSGSSNGRSWYVIETVEQNKYFGFPDNAIVHDCAFGSDHQGGWQMGPVSSCNEGCDADHCAVLTVVNGMGQSMNVDVNFTSDEGSVYCDTNSEFIL